MNDTKQSPIFVKTESFLLWLMQHTAKYPKHERFRLAKRIDDATFDFHACLIAAARQSDTQNNLLLADVELTKLRAYVRLGLESQYTTPKQYEYIARHLNEIGKLLGGWMRQVRV